MKKSTVIRLIVFLFSFLITPVRADVLVLVHGWAANADTWIQSGVLQALEASGWSNAGVVTAAADGSVYHHAGAAKLNDNKVYRAQLPAAAPLQIQAAHLYTELLFISKRHAGDSIILVGHSAGGVVSRLVLVSPQSPGIETLVTIASPNLGTERAIDGMDVIHDKPFFCPGPGLAFLKDTFGGDDYRYLKNSQGALIDLMPAVPGTLIGWLNQQPHPAIHYHSIIRSVGDELVPAFSQDLNQVPRLHGRSEVHLTQTSHALNMADGMLLANILGKK
ncbi:MAG: GPI inositol-deacylase [Gammaproteobacteria bacterium]|nr:GPI inositol-deacylase [Gammaproteobacteria bacterium]